MSTLVVVQPTPAGKGPNGTYRNVMQLGWCALGTKALEVVTQTQGDTTNAYYQVVRAGKEELQTISLKEAQELYDSFQ